MKTLSNLVPELTAVEKSGLAHLNVWVTPILEAEIASLVTWTQRWTQRELLYTGNDIGFILPPAYMAIRHNDISTEEEVELRVRAGLTSTEGRDRLLVEVQPTLGVSLLEKLYTIQILE